MTTTPSRSSRTQSPRELQVLSRIEAFRQRRPRLLEDVVTLAHGAGGKSSAALTDAVFLEAFGNPTLAALGDSAGLTLPSGERLAFSTDSYVVQPIQFPGGSIGHLAVHGTVNDLAVSGARPLWLSAGFVIEEGLSMDVLREIVADMTEAAALAGVEIVTGDTKVVPNGAADKLFINTAGIGLVPTDRNLGSEFVRPTDRVLVSGTMGDHGMAVMLARGELNIDADISSDTAALAGIVSDLLEAAPGTRWMRDATRGGVGTVLNELAKSANVGVIIEESRLPVHPTVNGACDLLGIDPLYVANEGKFVAVVPVEESEGALAALRAHPLGGDAAIIAEVVADPPGIVALRTPFGGSRIVDMLVGDPLPRIC